MKLIEKSFKKSVYSIVGMVFILLIFAFLSNIFYLQARSNTLYEFRESTFEIESLVNDSKLPVGVIKNVIAQINQSETMEMERKDRIIKAYLQNYEKLSDYVKRIKELSADVNQGIGVLVGDPLFGKVFTLGELDSSRKSLTVLIKETELLLSFYDPNNVNFKELDGEMVSENFESISKSTRKILFDSSQIRKKIMIFNLWWNNLIFLILLLSVIRLTIIIKRMIEKDIPFVLEGLKLLNCFDHDFEKLPKLNQKFLEEQHFESLMKEIFTEQSFLNEIKEISNRLFVLDDILDELFIKIQKIFPVDRIGVAFIDYEKQIMVAEYAISNYGEIALGAGYEVEMSLTSLVKIAQEKKSQCTDDIREIIKARPQSVTVRLLNEEGIRSNMIIPLISDNRVFGFIFFSSRKVKSFNEETVRIAEGISHELSSIINKTYFAKKMFATVTRTFAKLVEQKDNETGDHIKRMTDYSVAIASALLNHPDQNYRVNQSFVNDIDNDACVHDIGKVGIPDEILKKPGRLTADEWLVMQTHSEIGYNVMCELKEQLRTFNKDFYQTAIDIARYHHEKWDGSGYPMGLKGQEIPLSARIIAIADAFDAITSKRVYKSSIEFDKAVQIIRDDAGAHFDPVLVSVFESVLPKIKEIYKKLSSS